MRATLITGLALALAAAPAASVEDYDACLALIAEDAARAEREAGDWARFGGGAPARHCYALALIEAGAPLRAADELIGIAQEEPSLSDQARADVLVQAGELLVDADQVLTAGLVAEQAVRLAPKDGAALGLRAAVHLAENAPAKALADLNAALAAEPGDVRLLLRRASAQRRLGNAVAARDDAAFATERAPERASAWHELGRAEAALGFKPDARQSFLRAIALDRQGPVGRAARRSLQLMDAGLSE